MTLSVQNQVLANFQEAAISRLEMVKLEVENFETYQPQRIPHGVDLQHEKALRTTFLETHWDGFVEKMARISVDVTDADIDSIGCEKISETAQRFFSLYERANSYGFFHARGRCINFWSGEKAAKEAEANALAGRSLNDESLFSSVLFFRLFDDVVELEKQKGQFLIRDKVLRLYAATFASQAKGEVMCYCSNDSQTERQKSLIVGNHFWLAELPVLQRLRKRGVVTKISIAFPRGKTWQQVDLNNPQKSGNLHLYRRSQGELSPWSLPRPSLTLKCVRKVITSIRLYTYFKSKGWPVALCHLMTQYCDGHFGKRRVRLQLPSFEDFFKKVKSLLPAFSKA
jgi:hypothetical protein